MRNSDLYWLKCKIAFTDQKQQYGIYCWGKEGSENIHTWII